VHVLLRMESEWAAGVAKPEPGGRVALAIPWQGMLMLGTTDTPFEGDPSAVRADEADVRLILDEACGFLPAEMLCPSAVRFTLAGLRALPLGDGDTAASRRGHVIEVSPNGLVSVAGGKLTTHRQIACDALRHLPYGAPGGMEPDEHRLPGTGWSERARSCGALAPDVAGHLERLYGDEVADVLALADRVPGGWERVHAGGPDIWAQVAYAFESEWASTAADVARRRTTLAVRGLMTPEILERIARLAPRSEAGVAVM